MAKSTLEAQSRRNPGWFYSDNKIFDLGLSVYALAAYFYLCRRANRDGESFCSHATMAKACGMGVTRLKGALVELVEAHVVAMESRANQGRSTLYTVLDMPTEGSSPLDEGVVATRLGGSRHATTEGLPTEGRPTEGTPPKPPVGGSNGHGSNGYQDTAKTVLEWLNRKAGRQYQPTKANLDLIVARLKDGTTIDRCKAVIGRKTREWKDDPRMSHFLRPATLFNATKYSQYEGELPATAFMTEEELDALPS